MAKSTTSPTALGRAFKRRLKKGPALLGGMVQEYLRPSLVKLYRYAGFDFIYVEKEHGLFGGPSSRFMAASPDDLRGMPPSPSRTRAAPAAYLPPPPTCAGRARRSAGRHIWKLTSPETR